MGWNLKIRMNIIKILIVILLLLVLIIIIILLYFSLRKTKKHLRKLFFILKLIIRSCIQAGLLFCSKRYSNETTFRLHLHSWRNNNGYKFHMWAASIPLQTCSLLYQQCISFNSNISYSEETCSLIGVKNKSANSIVPRLVFRYWIS